MEKLGQAGQAVNAGRPPAHPYLRTDEAACQRQNRQDRGSSLGPFPAYHQGFPPLAAAANWSRRGQSFSLFVDPTGILRSGIVSLGFGGSLSNRSAWKVRALAPVDVLGKDATCAGSGWTFRSE